VKYISALKCLSYNFYYLPNVIEFWLIAQIVVLNMMSPLLYQEP